MVTLQLDQLRPCRLAHLHLEPPRQHSIIARTKVNLWYGAESGRSEVKRHHQWGDRLRTELFCSPLGVGRGTAVVEAVDDETACDRNRTSIFGEDEGTWPEQEDNGQDVDDRQDDSPPRDPTLTSLREPTPDL
jgi:hypothetical protein